MNLPAGTEEYQETHNGIAIQGFSYTENNIQQSAETIADICFDVSGQNNFNDYIASLNETGFNNSNLALSSIKDWQVGEGFAEAYLGCHFSCCFPWSNNRDLKNPNSSLTGADLVGYCNGQFAFGEVKTSKEQKSPPQVTSKKGDGLNAQLNKLCADADARWVLVQYLFHRQTDDAEYQSAFTSYLQNNKNFYIFGVLIRNTSPVSNDWNYLKKHLKPHAQNSVFLVGLYLPVDDGIQKLHQGVLSAGGAS